MNIISIDQIYKLLIELYPQRTVTIGIDLSGHVVYGVRRERVIEFNVWIGSTEKEKSIYHKFSSEDELVAYVDSLRMVALGRN